MRLKSKDQHSANPLWLIGQAISLEGRFAANRHTGRKGGPALIEIAGSHPILISCPHAVNHPREGKLKLADTFTGPLGRQLAYLTDAFALIYARTTVEDPNYDVDGPYKRKLVDLIRAHELQFVLDIHGIGKSRPMEIAIGTANGTTVGHNKRLIRSFVGCLRRAGFSRIIVDEPNLYDASRPTTIASYTWKALKIPAIQIEIQKLYRDPEKAPQEYLKLLYALSSSIHAVQRLLLPTDWGNDHVTRSPA